MNVCLCCVEPMICLVWGDGNKHTRTDDLVPCGFHYMTVR